MEGVGGGSVRGGRRKGGSGRVGVVGWEKESNNDNKGKKFHLMNDSSVCQELSTRGYLTHHLFWLTSMQETCTSSKGSLHRYRAREPQQCVCGDSMWG